MKLGRKTGAGSQGEGTRPGAEGRARGAEERPSPNASSVPSSRGRRGERGKPGFLDGQMLIAMPTMGGARLPRPVIYMGAHSADGAMGIVVNQPAPNITFPDLLVQLEVVRSNELI